jgi:hypothetical protein
MSQAKRKNLQSIFQTNSAEDSAPEPSPKNEKPFRWTSFRMNPIARKQLDILVAEQETSLQSLLCSAVNDLFEKHGKPRIA